MKKFTKITMFLVLAVFVAGMFVACGPSFYTPKDPVKVTFSFVDDTPAEGDKSAGPAEAPIATIKSVKIGENEVEVKDNACNVEKSKKFTIVIEPKEGYEVVSWNKKGTAKIDGYDKKTTFEDTPAADTEYEAHLQKKAAK